MVSSSTTWRPVTAIAPGGSSDDRRQDSAGSVLYVPAASRDRSAVRERLARTSLAVTLAADVTEGLQLLASKRFAVCLLDLAGERAALASIRIIRAQHPQVSIVGVIDPANPVVAGEAIHAGLVDLLPWPFEDRDIAMLLANARDRVGIDVLNGHLSGLGEPLFVHSPAMSLVMDLVREAASGRGGVTVCGEPGTGRALIARAIHGLADDGPDRPFTAEDCAGDGPQDLERRLFGVTSDGRDGAKAPASERISRDGAVTQAQHGTLFLTNLAEAPARVQAKLARLLRDREAVVVETRDLVELDIRPIASVEPGVDAAVADGRLRRDLFERLTQVRIDVPPLRRRREDIPLLAAYFLREQCEQQAAPAKSFSRSALTLLSALPWHGNAGELKTLLETLVRSVKKPVVQLDDLLEHASLEGLAARIDTGVSLREAKARFERECISTVLMRHHGRVGEAAKALGIQRTNLYRKVRQLNVARSLLSARK